MRKELRIKFKNEEGVDGGGLVREFFDLLVSEITDTKNKLFIDTGTYFRPYSR